MSTATIVDELAGVRRRGPLAVCGAVYVVALARRLASGAPSRERSVLLGAGLAAAAVSLVQYGMEIALNRAAHAGHVSAGATLFHAVNVADTVKLVLLAVAIAGATRLAGRAGAAPRWLLALGYALTPILVLGGAAFIVTSDAVAAVLALSLILLLVWVGAVAVVLSRTRAAAA